MLSIAVLAAVFTLTAVRRIGSLRFQIWQVMLLGALAVVVTGQISPVNALQAVNLDVILFLLGMFVTGQALEESGYLSRLSYRWFGGTRSLSGLILLVLFVMGMLSAILMNDTLAIIGTPMMLMLAKETKTSPKLMLITLAFAVTIGSVMSPIGNPQNLLIALNSDISNPFITFARYLLAPTAINLLFAYFLLRLYYRRQFNISFHLEAPAPLKDARLAVLCRYSLVLLGVLILVKVGLVFLRLPFDFRLTYIGIASMLPVVLFSPRRVEIVRKIDWCTLVFFAAMFVLMGSVWDSGFFQSAIASLRLDPGSGTVIMGVSVLLSQLISNVPLVALYLPMLNSCRGFH